MRSSFSFLAGEETFSRLHCCLLEMEDKDTLRQQVVESYCWLESTCKDGNHSISSGFPASASQTQASAQTSASLKVGDEQTLQLE